MKFIVNSQVFAKQLQAISGVITNNNTVPIITCFHFHLDEGKLIAKATDLETTIITTIEVESGKLDGLTDIAVPSRLLLDILKNMDDAPLTFIVDDNNFSIKSFLVKASITLLATTPTHILRCLLWRILLPPTSLLLY